MSNGLVSARQSDIHDNYVFLEELGHGAYGTVTRAQRRMPGGHLSYQSYAIKQIDKKRAGAKGLREVSGEVETMMLLTHQNVVRLEETYQDGNYLWIVMEYMAGGELAKALKQAGTFPEPTVRKMVMYLLFALSYIHGRGFVHRDLKPANCLIANAGEPMLKIADFGFAVLSGSDECLRSFCGTTAYMAPEILLDMSYGRPVDMWALGVIVFQMLGGELPFVAQPGEQVTDLITEGRFGFGAPAWQTVSPGAKDFICGLLEMDSTRRATANECLEHSWLQSAMGNDRPGRSRGMGGGKRNPLVLFRGAVIAVLASHRLVYLGRLRRLKREGADVPLLRCFSYLVGNRYTPPSRAIDCSGQFTGHGRALLAFLRMFETADQVESLDLSCNGIDTLDLAQAVVRSVTNHPSLVTLHLDDNALPPLVGRALVRLARAPNKLRSVTLANTPIPTDVIQHIQTALKEAERKGQTVASPTASFGTLPAPPGAGSRLPTPSLSQRSSSNSNRWRPAAATPQVGVTRSGGPRLPPLPNVSSMTASAVGRRK